MSVQTLLEQAVREGLTPGAACFVSHAGRVFELHVGNSKPELEYDLASLTKILCTTYLAAQAVAEGKLALDEMPWPEWHGVSVRHVLAHNSGLPAWVRVHSFEDVKRVKLVARPGEKIVYSDIGFMALGKLLEERYHQTLDKLFPPLQKGGQGGFSWSHYHGPMPVDDENCHDLGGVTGHAGLFGTLDSVKSEAEYFLRCLMEKIPPSPPFSKGGIIRQFAEAPGARALGFDRPTPGGSTGEALSPSTVGHLAFTGCSLWLDPETKSIYILLMRVLGRDSDTRAKLLKLRREFHKAVALIDNA